MSTRVCRAVAVGYQGFGNLGDEAILAGIERLLDGTRIRITTVVGGDRGPIAADPAVHRITGRRMLPRMAGLRALQRSDALILSGGGLLHDHWALVVPQYLAWVVAARALGCRVAWVGVGIGPLRRRPSRWLTGLALRLSHLVLVRDERSARLAREAGARRVTVIPDPAFYLAPDGDHDQAGPEADAPLVVIPRAPLPGTCDPDALAEALAGAAAAQWREVGRACRLVTFAGPRDDEFVARVSARLDMLGVPVTVVPLPPVPARALGELSAAAVVLTVRLHGVVLASAAATPWAAVIYDDKVAAVTTYLDAADLAVPIAEADAASLAAALERATTPDRAARLSARVAEVTATRTSVATMLEDALA